MSRFFVPPVLFFATYLVALPTASAVTINWTPVGNTGNAAAFTGVGSVDYSYNIATYDLTNSQYVEFLNTVDATGANVLGLYHSQMTADANGGINFNAAANSGSKYSAKSTAGNHPVNFVSWFDSLRFANWLNNGQGSGDTETGAYTLLGGAPTPSNAFTITRNAGAHIVIPSDNEWTKAAFYNPASSSYFLFPTGSSQSPNPTTPTSAPNSVNSNGAVGTLTDVGAYTGTTSPYGAFDMGGNVYQWTDTNKGGVHVKGGSFFNNNPGFLTTDDRVFVSDVVDKKIGFRVAMVPEPGTLVLAALCGVMLLAFGRRSVR